VPNSRHAVDPGQWLEHGPGGIEKEARLDGRKLAKEKGCLGCHSLDGTPGVGPSFKGIMGRSEVVLTEGRERTITVDEAYLQRSLLDPSADLVKGFQPVMPAYKDLSAEEITELLEFLRDVK